MLYSFYMAIMKIKGVVKDYAWGNKDFLPSLLGYEISDKPQAEYWMGTHPSGEAVTEGRKLSEVINRRLPFLFKVLAIDSPLSLQCHPNKIQAKEGWKKEEELRAKKEACNYQDDNEKAEVLCALTPVTALCGFKPFDEAVAYLNKYIPSSFDTYLKEKKDIKELFLSLFGLNQGDKDIVLKELETSMEGKAKTQDDYYTTEGVISTVLKKYPGDIGCVFPLMMNVVHVAPGEALYLEPDTLHAYVKGNGMELMTASDNVLRGGLTPKRIDLKELSSLLYFGPSFPENVKKREKDGIINYMTPSPDFMLSRMDDGIFNAPLSVDAIVIVEKGEAEIKDQEDKVVLKKGEVCFIEKGSAASITVTGTLYMASEAYN